MIRTKIFVDERVGGQIKGIGVILKKKGEFYLQFLSCNGEIRQVVKLERGAEYIIAYPDFVKKLPALVEDTEWSRRWVREQEEKDRAKGRCCGRNYPHFEILNGGVYRKVFGNQELIRKCPATLQKLVIMPLNGVAFEICLVNRMWLAKTNYESFCEEMKNKSLTTVRLFKENK